MKKRGFTLVELIVVLTIVGILASAFTYSVFPMMNTLFFFPQSGRVNSAAADLLKIIADGDNRAKGLRYAGPPCAVPTGGSNTITAASGTSLTYHYALADECGGASANHTVILTYDTTNRVVTRQIDGGDVHNIPSYVTAASEIQFDRFESNADGSIFFRYYNSAGTEMTSATPITTTSIYRVDIPVRALTGTGAVVRDSSGNIQMKTGVEIKRYTS